MSHAVLESFSKAAQVLTITRPPFESMHKSKPIEFYWWIDLCLGIEGVKEQGTDTYESI
jgi:hypothetical protein